MSSHMCTLSYKITYKLLVIQIRFEINVQLALCMILIKFGKHWDLDEFEDLLDTHADAEQKILSPRDIIWNEDAHNGMF